MPTRRIGVVMDPIESINPAKDTTLAMLLAAQARGWSLYEMQQADLSARDGTAEASYRPLTVRDDFENWFEKGPVARGELSDFDVILMRKDPPFDMEYIYTTYLLERAEQAGTLIVNRPRALRDVNEKAYTAWFADLCPPTLIARSIEMLKAFSDEHGKTVVKPLDGMGGKSIFLVDPTDQNRNVIFETITQNQSRYVMAQKYIPEIRDDGDKRVLVVDGEAVPYTLARIPASDDLRGNLAVGARAEGRPITDREREICAEIGPKLRDMGILFAGIDVIGNWVTEINVTSPTCIRELDKEFNLDIAGDLMTAIERRLDTQGARKRA